MVSSNLSESYLNPNYLQDVNPTLGHLRYRLTKQTDFLHALSIASLAQDGVKDDALEQGPFQEAKASVGFAPLPDLWPRALRWVVK